MDPNWSIMVYLSHESYNIVLLGSFGKPEAVTAVSPDAEAAASHVEGMSAKAIALVTSLTKKYPT